ncbi:MAG: radical SAM family heme chaperone HemW [Abditibacteriales bacterium]|nr:radical SAM family heme chaperone HemW [Abditibacteriales bacterium]MDW8364475.1 radical SAM family heme chaperone HemW [Abditibacteriales bacterium]
MKRELTDHWSLVTMLGLYIHIPFCEQRCPYCDFNTYAGVRAQLVEDYVDALRRELVAQLTPLARAERVVDTIFFGGGTPTFLSAAQLEGILQTVRESIAVRPNAEITLEANPSTVANPELSPAKLEHLRRAGFNRLSIGVQSFDDACLRTLGRAHSAVEAKETFRLARLAGYDNINIDLMFAVPGQTMGSWQQTLTEAMALHPEHISAYCLTYEKATPFYRWRATGRLRPLSEDAEAEMFERAMDALTDAGYEHYEISNFARPGKRAQHNQIYWRGEEYVGAGAGAHGYLNGVRYWNEKLPQRYVARVSKEGRAIVGSERLSARARLGEALMLGLRLLDGVSLDAMTERFQLDPRDVFEREMRRLTAFGLVRQENGRLWLTRQGVLLANRVFMEFV